MGKCILHNLPCVFLRRKWGVSSLLAAESLVKKDAAQGDRVEGFLRAPLAATL